MLETDLLNTPASRQNGLFECTNLINAKWTLLFIEIQISVDKFPEAITPLNISETEKFY